MMLLERERELALLNERLDRARAGHGSMVLISGEAGIGKSALARSIDGMLGDGQHLLIGSCDPLTTPAAHGPLHDLSLDLGSDIAALLEQGASASRLLPAVLTALRSMPGAVLLFEDLHWADEGTLDLLRFLSRRIDSLPVLLIATMRDDEPGQQPGLRLFLGDLARAPAYRRVALAPLSAEAVGSLVGDRPFSAAALHRRTGGNPFFVSEVLSTEAELPASVSDAILGRLSRLDPEVQRVVHIAAVIGPARTVELISAVAGHDSSEAVDEAIQAGLLQHGPAGIEFRHELARDATLEAITPLRRREIYRAILSELPRVEPSADPAWMAHYAAGTGDPDAIRTYSALAAERAAAQGANREAAHHYQRALAAANDQPDDIRIPLLEGYARATLINGWADEDILTRTELIERYRAMGDRRAEIEQLRQLAVSNFHAGRNSAGHAAIRAAVELLDELPEEALHAQVFGTQAMILMLDRDNDAAIEWGHRAIEFAERYDGSATMVRAQNAIGSALIVSGNLEEGRLVLEAAIAAALECGQHGLAINLRSNLGSAAGEIFELATAETALLEVIHEARELDLDGPLSYAFAWLALVRLHQGRWDESARLAMECLSMPHGIVISFIMANVALGRVRARRGDPGVWESLDEALLLAEPTGTLQRLAPVAAARAEARWLEGDLPGVTAEAMRAYELAIDRGHRWHASELSYWLRQSGVDALPPFELIEPWRRETPGDTTAAIADWTRRGCRYEAARARLDAGTVDDLLLALREFEALGARPMVQRTAQRLRELGVAAIPRGPRRETRANPAGLTARELDVLERLRAGDPNGEIAATLYISPRTVENHVASIFAKLKVTSRRDAVRIAATLLDQRPVEEI
jgi:DNA-binding CsgD family transcriptional regulator/tetratricopeptide (TPR) repeat protein